MAIGPRPWARLVACAVVAGAVWSAAAGCGGEAGSGQTTTTGDSGRAVLARVPDVRRILAHEGASVDAAREVRFGAVDRQAWVVTSRRADCMVVNMTPDQARGEPLITTQCVPRTRRERRGLVATMGTAIDAVAVYGLAPAGARQALVVGAGGTEVATVEDGRFGVVTRAPRFVQFVTADGITPRVPASTPRS